MIPKYLKKRIASVRENRESAKDTKALADKVQKELIPGLMEMDPDKVGIVYDPDDEEHGAAFWQQNSGTEVWKTEEIIDWLREPKNKKLWRDCSSRVFDIKKWEAEVGARTITPKRAKKFKTTTEPPSPFIRFDKPKDNSIR